MTNVTSCRSNCSVFGTSFQRNRSAKCNSLKSNVLNSDLQLLCQQQSQVSEYFISMERGRKGMPKANTRNNAFVNVNLVYALRRVQKAAAINLLGNCGQSFCKLVWGGGQLSGLQMSLCTTQYFNCKRIFWFHM